MKHPLHRLQLGYLAIVLGAALAAGLVSAHDATPLEVNVAAVQAPVDAALEAVPLLLP